MKIKNVVVIGSGTMGSGIAAHLCNANVPVTLLDLKTEISEKAREKIHKSRPPLLIDKSKINNIKVGNISDDFDVVKDADWIVEAVVEKESVKKVVLAETESLIGEKAILASNTSTISITKLAQGLKRPEQFCGMHFFNPVHRMPLVEVIRGEKSSESTIAATVAYAAAMGKSPIVVNDCPGFLVNRVLFPYFAGFAGLVNDGVDFKKIDKVMEKFGWPMGPAFLLDVVGIDTAFHAGGVMAAGYPDRMSQDIPTIISKMYEKEWYGQKNDKGFYIHSKDKKGKPKKEENPSITDLVKELSVGIGDAIRDIEIIDRMMLPMLMESSRCLEDNIVETPIEVDMGLIYGLGFPPFRGGIFRWADTIGLNEIIQRSEKYKALGKVYEPTEQIMKMAKDEKLFHRIE